VNQHFVIWMTVLIAILSFQYCENPVQPEEKVSIKLFTIGEHTQILEEREIDNKSKIPINNQNYSNYAILAKKNGYYSEFYTCNAGDTVFVNLDNRVKDSKMCGGIFLTEESVPVEKLGESKIQIFQNGVKIKSIKTDSFGNYAIDIQRGTYMFSGDGELGFVNFKTEVELNHSYNDIFVENYTLVRKPNIYIYPEKETKLKLSLNFPRGGHITRSKPKYDLGWKVSVTPDGVINNQYDYLFYECEVPGSYQHKKGWVKTKQNLEEFFNSNLKKAGFNKKEINDFIQYWIPRLDKYQKYVIYPQKERLINNLIDFQFTEKPESVLRLFYYIKGVNSSPPDIRPPRDYESFNRKGFTVVEWGVIFGS